MVKSRLLPQDLYTSFPSFSIGENMISKQGYTANSEQMLSFKDNITGIRQRRIDRILQGVQQENYQEVKLPFTKKHLELFNEFYKYLKRNN